MAYAPARSCNKELREGATDGGTWKLKTSERGGFVQSPSNQYQVGPGHVCTPMRGVLGPKGCC